MLPLTNLAGMAMTSDLTEETAEPATVLSWATVSSTVETVPVTVPRRVVTVEETPEAEPVAEVRVDWMKDNCLVSLEGRPWTSSLPPETVPTVVWRVERAPERSPTLRAEVSSVGRPWSLAGRLSRRVGRPWIKVGSMATLAWRVAGKSAKTAWSLAGSDSNCEGSEAKVAWS
ncbi:hypothetical protein BC940DRAFT_293112 [Gongronella butleri]|nr:hypothetical protein BC940DRAFT_293112 [Gongronella butleri]